MTNPFKNFGKVEVSLVAILAITWTFVTAAIALLCLVGPVTADATTKAIVLQSTISTELMILGRWFSSTATSANKKDTDPKNL